MKRRVYVGFFVAAVLLVVCFATGGETPTYIGEKKCKMCHKVQYNSWLETTHAKAGEQLCEGHKENPECLACHATGGKSEFPGVQCEACHGPGSLYKSMKIMKDRQLAVSNGLILKSKETCMKCHDKENKTFAGNEHHKETPTMKGMFNFEESLKSEKAIHAHKTE